MNWTCGCFMYMWGVLCIPHVNCPIWNPLFYVNPAVPRLETRRCVLSWLLCNSVMSYLSSHSEWKVKAAVWFKRLKVFWITLTNLTASVCLALQPWRITSKYQPHACFIRPCEEFLFFFNGTKWFCHIVPIPQTSAFKFAVFVLCVTRSNIHVKN